MPKRRTISVITAGALSLAGVPAAEAKSAKANHRLTATVSAAIVSQVGTPPNPGSSELNAGVLTSSLGNGAGISSLSFATGQGPGGFTFGGSYTFLTSHGSIRAVFTSGTGTLQPTRNVTFNGTLAVKGGTERFEGARGLITVTATSGANRTITLKFHGRIRY
jgi:hypothetical protein